MARPNTEQRVDTVYKLSHHGTAWILSNLHEFAVGFDGAGPEAPVVFGPDGSR